MRYEDQHEAEAVKLLDLDVACLAYGRLSLQLSQVLAKEQELLLKQFIELVDGYLRV